MLVSSLAFPAQLVLVLPVLLVPVALFLTSLVLFVGKVVALQLLFGFVRFVPRAGVLEYLHPKKKCQVEL